jgi:hypothetical protein
MMITEQPSTDILISQAPGGHWASFRRQPDGTLRRLASPRLPLRATREQAESDLRAYAYHKFVNSGPAEALAWDNVYDRLLGKEA